MSYKYQDEQEYPVQIVSPRETQEIYGDLYSGSLPSRRTFVRQRNGQRSAPLPSRTTSRSPPRRMNGNGQQYSGQRLKRTTSRSPPRRMNGNGQQYYGQRNTRLSPVRTSNTVQRRTSRVNNVLPQYRNRTTSRSPPRRMNGNGQQYSGQRLPSRGRNEYMKTRSKRYQGNGPYFGYNRNSRERLSQYS